MNSATSLRSAPAAAAAGRMAAWADGEWTEQVHCHENGGQEEEASSRRRQQREPQGRGAQPRRHARLTWVAACGRPAACPPEHRGTGHLGPSPQQLDLLACSAAPCPSPTPAPATLAASSPPTHPPTHPPTRPPTHPPVHQGAVHQPLLHDWNQVLAHVLDDGALLGAVDSREELAQVRGGACRRRQTGRAGGQGRVRDRRVRQAGIVRLLLQAPQAANRAGTEIRAGSSAAGPAARRQLRSHITAQ